jgi:hypothetical protein
VETQVWLDHAHAGGDINVAQHRELDNAGQHIGAMVTSPMRRVDDFCRLASK